MKSKKFTPDLGVNNHNGALSKQHWEMDVSESVFPRGTDESAKAILPRSPKDRPQPHKKINEYDY